MFRRDVDGVTERFAVAGLWGSGNTVSPRSGLYAGAQTSYSMWDGHALFGPGRPGSIERFPVFVANLDFQIFLERYGDLDDCRVWVDEVLGIGCEEACTHLAATCADHDPEVCIADCAVLPRSIIECLQNASSCEEEADCGRAKWHELNRSP